MNSASNCYGFSYPWLTYAVTAHWVSVSEPRTTEVTDLYLTVGKLRLQEVKSPVQVFI